MSDFPNETITFERSAIVAAFLSSEIPPSNQRLYEFLTCLFYVNKVRDNFYVPDKIRKREILLMFPKLNSKLIDAVFAINSDGHRGRRRKNWTNCSP